VCGKKKDENSSVAAQTKNFKKRESDLKRESEELDKEIKDLTFKIQKVN